MSKVLTTQKNEDVSFTTLEVRKGAEVHTETALLAVSPRPCGTLLFRPVGNREEHSGA